MFQIPLTGALGAIEALRASLVFNRALRDGVAAKSAALLSGLPQSPPLDEWRRLDYSTTVTRLYQIYESFVHECIKEWLADLSKLVSYKALPEELKKTHRNGLGWILQNFEGRRFEDLTVADTIRDYAAALAESSPYTLLADAFLLHERNLRVDELGQVLRGCGLDISILDWLKSHPISKHDSLQLLGHSSVDKCVSVFVDLRNEASHATRKLGELLGDDALLAYVDFIGSLCEALVEAFASACMKWHLEHGAWIKAGRVTMVTKTDKRVCIAPLENCTISVGVDVYVSGSNYFRRARLQEIQDEGVSIPSLTIAASAKEVGLRFGIEVFKSSWIYVQVSQASAAYPASSSPTKPESIIVGAEDASIESSDSLAEDDSTGESLSDLQPSE